MTTQNLTVKRSTARQQARRRHQVLQDMCRGIAENPSCLLAEVDAALPDFDSLDDVLVAAHASWARTFEARLDALLESGAYGDQRAFDALWDATARDLVGLVVLLDHFREHPAVAAARGAQARRVRNALAVELPRTWATARVAA